MAKTKTGFEYKIEEGVADDWELLESFQKMEKEPWTIVDVAERLIGKNQLEKLKQHVKSIHGRCTITAMSNEIIDIFNGENVKNL